MKIIMVIFLFISSYTIILCEKSILDIKEEKTSLSTINWLKDDLTLPLFSTKIDESEVRDYLSGLRIVFEPQFSALLQDNLNKIDASSLYKIPKIGLETNLYQSWISLQFVFIYPSSVNFDDNSEIVKLKLLNNNEKKLSLNHGFAFGLSFIDGIITIGYMKLNYDTRDFISKSATLESSGMFYVNFQPVATVKSLFKRIK